MKTDSQPFILKLRPRNVWYFCVCFVL